MEKMISCCGITCSECPAFKATKMNDDNERKRVAELWTKEYGRLVGIGDINCDGCLSQGTRVFAYCNICEIRRCAQNRKLANCAHCQDYKCEKLAKLHEQAPKLKETLDAINRAVKSEASV